MTESFDGHIITRFDNELDRIHSLVLEMGGLAAEQVQRALEALRNKDLEAVRRIIQRDNKVDTLESVTDEQIAAVIARRSPVARDLRLLLAVSKGMTNLERVGDGAVKIARLTLEFHADSAAPPPAEMLREICHMGFSSVELFREALEAFDRLDTHKAREILRRERGFESDFQANMRAFTTYVLEDPRMIGHSIRAALLMKAIERIGDHAENLAEYIIYIMEAKDIRHQSGGNEE